jgi:hypothetical protein
VEAPEEVLSEEDLWEPGVKVENLTGFLEKLLLLEPSSEILKEEKELGWRVLC